MTPMLILFKAFLMICDLYAVYSSPAFGKISCWWLIITLFDIGKHYCACFLKELFTDLKQNKLYTNRKK